MNTYETERVEAALGTLDHPLVQPVNIKSLRRKGDELVNEGWYLFLQEDHTGESYWGVAKYEEFLSLHEDMGFLSTWNKDDIHWIDGTRHWFVTGYFHLGGHFLSVSSSGYMTKDDDFSWRHVQKVWRLRNDLYETS